ncbi:MAG: hypothetical protein A2X78_00750 [Gammaproteobacteria bacterium GWE2_37_16]|nr:MAG: hypothetical protein A2X78_00750 [Gammaproteobacteria bacterium GWE2_37_16]
MKFNLVKTVNIFLVSIFFIALSTNVLAGIKLIASTQPLHDLPSAELNIGGEEALKFWQYLQAVKEYAGFVVQRITQNGIVLESPMLSCLKLYDSPTNSKIKETDNYTDLYQCTIKFNHAGLAVVK